MHAAPTIVPGVFVSSDLVSGTHSAGQHSVTWDGKDSNGNVAATGMYFIRIKTSTFAESKKMLLLK